jgi:ADP-heptose:LPS heptosyltransferase
VLSLSQLWRLLARAALLVAPDTGVAHLGRVVGIPTVALFGPGSAMISGGGAFWCDAPFRAVSVDPFPCRDQQVLFKREIAWVRRCGRTTAECPHPRCMDAIDVDRVIEAIDDLGIASRD